MDSFFIYDMIFLVLFSLFVTFFLYKRKKALSREGIIFMYRTQAGVKAINFVGDKFKKTLQALKAPVITLGFILMAVMLWMLGQTLSIYILFPEITKVIKAPPIAPLIPYFPKLFGMESFFPPFYFTYFIIALGIVAVVHEFSHGIFMRRFGVKIKSTGLVFLGPILGAFVEEEKRGFVKKKNSEQMTILGAGVFANIVFAFIFYLLYVGFFFSSFMPAGYNFNSYGVSAVPLSEIVGFENYGNLTRVITKNESYYLDKTIQYQVNNLTNGFLIAYPESPAVLLQIMGDGNSKVAITSADDVRILNEQDLRSFLETKRPGDKIKLSVSDNGQEKDYSLTLGKHPLNNSRAYLGVGYNRPQPRGTVQKFFAIFMGFKDPTTLYIPSWNSEFVYFILNLLWWIMVINLLVGLFNMLPLGMLDGGRFFYLGVLSITKSKKWAKRAYKFVTYLILGIFLALMFFWFIRII